MPYDFLRRIGIELLLSISDNLPSMRIEAIIQKFNLADKKRAKPSVPFFFLVDNLTNHKPKPKRPPIEFLSELPNKYYLVGLCNGHRVRPKRQQYKANEKKRTRNGLSRLGRFQIGIFLSN